MLKANANFVDKFIYFPILYIVMIKEIYHLIENMFIEIDNLLKTKVSIEFYEHLKEYLVEVIDTRIEKLRCKNGN